MSKTKLSKIIAGLRLSMDKHSPEILTGVGIAGMIITVITAVRATPKALKLIEQKKEEAKADKLTPVQTVKAAWVCYIPSVVVGAVSTACLIGSTSVNARRNAALGAAYALSESAMNDYREKIVKTIGEKKDQSTLDAIAKDKISQNPVVEREVIVTNAGDALCYDAVSGRYFKSSIEKLKKTENELNRRMRDETYISLNEFYYEIGLKPISVGDDLGWNIDKGYIDLSFSSQLTDDGTPCLVVGYAVRPQYDYWS